MANKLKNIFSNEEIILNETIRFKNQESYDEFMAALETVQEEGKHVKVKGIDSLKTFVRTGNGVYPVAEHDRICDFVVAPSVEPVTFEVDTEYGKKEITLRRYCINRGIVLETSADAVVYLKMIFEKETEKSKITYRAQPENAKSVKDVLENYSMILSFFNKLFRPDIAELKDGTVIKDMKEYFETAITGYKKLEYVEKEFGINFEPKDLLQNEECWLELEEIYLTLKEKKVIRPNVKVNDTETTGMRINQQQENIKVGTPLEITFLVDIDYPLWGKSVKLHAACLLSNAIVKEINKTADDEIKVLYGGEDSRPMYISYRGFKTKKEAEEEINHIMENKDMYVNALTVMGHINQKI